MLVKFIEAGGVPTRFYEAGAGDPLILVHGVGVSSDSWMRNIEALGRYRHVLAVDLIGCGFTPPGDYLSGPPQPAQVNHLCAFMDAVGLKRASLAGSSLGGWIAALTALDHPDRVSNLILIGCAAMLSDRISQMGAMLERVYENGRSAFVENTYQSCLRRMTNLVFDPESIPEALLLMQMTSNAQPWSLAAYDTRMRGLADFETGRRYELGPRLRDIACPKLVISGREDPRDPINQVETVFDGVPKTQFAVFDNCGHFPFLEHPDQFNETVLQFLEASGNQGEIE
jgi:2-hydroxy-6-oxonona-2,4-dienedioate hydrolase